MQSKPFVLCHTFHVQRSNSPPNIQTAGQLQSQRRSQTGDTTSGTPGINESTSPPVNFRLNAFNPRFQMFDLLFDRFGLAYSRLFPPMARRILEFFTLIMAFSGLGILIYIHIMFVRSPPTCLDHLRPDDYLSQNLKSSSHGQSPVSFGSDFIPSISDEDLESEGKSRKEEDKKPFDFLFFRMFRSGGPTDDPKPALSTQPNGLSEKPVEKWPREGVLRVEVLRNAPADYDLAASYAKEFAHREIDESYYLESSPGSSENSETSSNNLKSDSLISKQSIIKKSRESSSGLRSYLEQEYYKMRHRLSSLFSLTWHNAEISEEQETLASEEVSVVNSDDKKDKENTFVAVILLQYRLWMRLWDFIKHTFCKLSALTNPVFASEP
ncbi:unnamed protein product [Protopolystoma xenopodis]|uniref:Uncharacterized protein n=1 Tax=Protopolystoma xenopodis TaxID=117903 RepID=A0A3S5APM2_9PLAT|nr:unnamed protein product [Protopolystoma xenopodis]